MKYVVPTFVSMILLFCYTPALAQLSDENELPEKYRTIYAGIGPRFLKTIPGTISVSYVDDSPSKDKFTGSFDVSDGYQRIGVHFGYKWGRYNGLSHKISIDQSIGKHFGGLAYYGIGWNISHIVGNKSLTLTPSIFGGFGNFGFDIGNLENNASFIQINDHRYFDSSLAMTLKSQVLFYGAEVNVDFAFSDYFVLWGNLGYDIAGRNNRPHILFEGKDNSSALNTDDSNPSLLYNGESVTSLPYDATGLRLSIGLAFQWNRY